jgi:hypothetical protein
MSGEHSLRSEELASGTVQPAWTGGGRRWFAMSHVSSSAAASVGYQTYGTQGSRAVTRTVHARRVGVATFDPTDLLEALRRSLAGRSEQRARKEKVWPRAAQPAAQRDRRSPASDGADGTRSCRPRMPAAGTAGQLNRAVRASSRRIVGRCGRRPAPVGSFNRADREVAPIRRTRRGLAIRSG